MPLHIYETNPPNPSGKGDFFLQYPLTNQNGTPNIYNEAYHYSRDHLLQRDVEIEVLELAKCKSPNLLSSLKYINHGFFINFF